MLQFILTREEGGHDPAFLLQGPEPAVSEGVDGGTGSLSRHSGHLDKWGSHSQGFWWG